MLFETEHWIVVLHKKQTYLGRSYVVLKRHCGDLALMTKEEWLDFAEVTKKFEAAVTSAFEATLFNWSCLMNHAFRNESPNPHVHWHVRPRYSHETQIGSTVFADPNFGEHYDRKEEVSVPPEIRTEIVERIVCQL